MDEIQHRLDRLMRLFEEEQAANRARQEEMQFRIDALSNGPHRHEEETHSRFNRPPGGGGGGVPRYAKLDFPKYDGNTDPLGWLSRCEHFFRHQQTPTEDMVGLASFHLEGNAQLWYIQLTEDYQNLTWIDFKEQCNLRFGPPVRSNKLGELAKLKQTGTVAEYQTQFEILVSRAGTLSQSQKVQLYISGLTEHISVEVELHHPRDLATAMSVSRLYERRSSAFESDTPAVTAATTTTAGRTIRRLTHAEMNDRRNKGLCFNCDEPFTRGHQCAKLFWIDLKEEPPDANQLHSYALEDKCRFHGGV